MKQQIWTEHKVLARALGQELASVSFFLEDDSGKSLPTGLSLLIKVRILGVQIGATTIDPLKNGPVDINLVPQIGGTIKGGIEDFRGLDASGTAVSDWTQAVAIGFRITALADVTIPASAIVALIPVLGPFAKAALAFLGNKATVTIALGDIIVHLGFFGVTGIGTDTGVLGVAGPGPGFAGFFDGQLFVTGNLLVEGALVVLGAPKSAAVPFPDGSHRQLYCLESPESWFEDFGRGRLTDGRAWIELEPDFAAAVNTDAYHVFVTEYGDNSALYVTNCRNSGFEVRAKTPTREITFSYRIVAKRKDIAPARLAKLTLPTQTLEKIKSKVAELRDHGA